MKKSQIILLVGASLILAACGGKKPTNSTSRDPIKPGTYEYGLGGLPVLDDGVVKRDTAGFTKDDFLIKMEDMYYGKSALKSYKYSKDLYLRSKSKDATHELVTTAYEYRLHDTLGVVMTGKAFEGSGTGIVNVEETKGVGYGYDIQSYAAGGYLHYIEVVAPDTAARVSYDSISKNNRYNNMYTIYSANPDLSLIKGAYKYAYGAYDPTEEEIASYIDASTGEAIYKITVEEYSSYIDMMLYNFVYVHADITTRNITRIDYGWVVYDVGGGLDKPESINTIRCDAIYDLDYGQKDTYTGKIYTEKDVDKIYGGPAQHYVDYSKWEDGQLNQDQSKEILSNLQVFATNTKQTVATFSIDRFVDPVNSVDIDGEFNIVGSIRGQYTTKKYANDFVETTGTGSISSESGTLMENFTSTVQAEANDDGMYVIEDYSTNKITSHKHTWSESTVDDVDPYIGVNPIYRGEFFHPFEIAGKYGTNCENIGDDGDASLNYYSVNGTLIKSGNTIAATFTKIYHKNVWTPYWTYTGSFKIEDGFLSELSLTVNSYYETDTSTYEISSSFTFANTKGDNFGEYQGTKLNLDDYDEPDMLAKNEWLYK